MKKNNYPIYLKLFFWLFFGIFSLGQLQRFELSNIFPQVNSGGIYLHEILMVGFVFAVLPLLFQKLHRFLSVSKVKKLTKRIEIKFTLWIFATTLIAQALSFDTTALLYLVRITLYLLFSITVFLLLREKRIDQKYFHFQLFSVGIFSLLLGFLQYIFIPDTRFLSIFGWDDHYARLIGSYFDPGFTGLLLLFSFLIGLAHPWLQKYKLVIFSIFTIGIVLTFSRATYLAFLISIVSLQILKSKRILKNAKKLLGFLVVFVFLVLIIPKPTGEGVDLLRTASIQARISALILQFSELEPKTLLFGEGMFANYVNTSDIKSSTITTVIPSHSRIPDNMFMAILIYTGIPGLLFSLCIFFKYLKQFAQKNIYAFSILSAYLVHAQFNNSLFQPFTQLFFVLGMIILVLQNSKTQIHK